MSIPPRWHGPRPRALARVHRHRKHGNALRSTRAQRLRRTREGETPQPLREKSTPGILLVDDSQATRQAVAELLQEYAYTVHTAGGIQEMERVVQTIDRPPEIAILEFRLRDGRGDVAAARVRERWPDVFVLYFSCVQPDDDPALRSALLAPATALLVKPTSLEVVLQAVQGTQTRVRSQATPAGD